MTRGATEVGPSPGPHGQFMTETELNEAVTAGIEKVNELSAFYVDFFLFALDIQDAQALLQRKVALVTEGPRPPPLCRLYSRHLRCQLSLPRTQHVILTRIPRP